MTRTYLTSLAKTRYRRIYQNSCKDADADIAYISCKDQIDRYIKIFAKIADAEVSYISCKDQMQTDTSQL